MPIMRVRMAVMTVRAHCLNRHGAAMGDLAVRVLELNSGVLNAEARPQSGVDVSENATSLRRALPVREIANLSTRRADHAHSPRPRSLPARPE